MYSLFGERQGLNSLQWFIDIGLDVIQIELFDPSRYSLNYINNLNTQTKEQSFTLIGIEDWIV